MADIRKAACIGGGVIGAGWAARFLLNGIDVAIFDPDPEVERKVSEVLANAERAYSGMVLFPLGPKGKITFAKSVAEAVKDAEFIQESAPERLELKQKILKEIDAAAPAATVIGSSTSGLKPTDMQKEMARPERLLVGHPFNPVYLLPLVEVVGGEKTSQASVARAHEVYESIGMKPVTIAKEIEAFVGDRLLESMWREALWLIKDDITTVKELDDVMRYGFGLRWAQMGMFEIYRVAGGEAGMRHFMAQFGPCLKWPWTKFTDVVDLDDALVDKIARQSDEQAAGRSIRELERIRDDNLVAIMQALRGWNGGEGWGAGEALKKYEERLQARAFAVKAEGIDPSKPLRLHRTKVPAGWIDYNGHMNESRYLQVFCDASDALLRHIGVDSDYVASGRSYYTAETHIMHLGECKVGTPLAVDTQVLSSDEKRLHVLHSIVNTESGAVVATAEQMFLHVDMKAQKATPADPAVLARLAPIAKAHAGLAKPDFVGRHVGAPRKK